MREGLLQSFADAKSRFERQSRPEPRLSCRVGDMNCAVLKLQRPAWTNDYLTKIGNQTGIFFSIWINDAAAEAGRADYNVHSMSVRLLKRYRLMSNEFCDQFREAFAEVRHGWPNVSTDFGCGTLMQGSYAIREANVASDALDLMNRYESEITPIVDHLLNERIKIAKAGRRLPGRDTADDATGS
jgi:hypothetical protein